MRTKWILLSFLLLLPWGRVVAQESGVAEVVNAFNSRYPQEKVFLHFDNTAYYLNEIIWFKAYLLRTDTDSLGSLSRVLYVELVDPGGQVVETKKCLVSGGTAHGEFLLGRYTQSGFYQVRAYTRYMLNWGSECVFSRVLPVFEKPAVEGDYSDRHIVDPNGMAEGGASDVSSPSASDISVRFFPEGGSLVRGLASRVAFEVVDGQGRHVEASGWLKEGKKRLERVATMREGRGVFDYIPPADGKVRACLELKSGEGKTRIFDLPEAALTGFVMHVDASHPDQVTWTAQGSASLSALHPEVLLLHHGKARVVSSPLKRSDMPDGCSQLCLVDRNGAMLASRMVFNYPRLPLGRVDVGDADSTIWPDKPMSLKVATTPGASLSLSVVDAETQLAAETHQAATWLLLTSDLKGYIRHPEYYFELDDATHRQAADLLMMVQGWRRYDVERMDGIKEWTKTFPVERGLLVDGRLKAYSKRNPVSGANLEVTMKSSLGSVLSGNVTTDSTGYYVFAVPDCWREWSMLMHTTRNDKDVRYYITVNRNFSPEVLPASYDARYDDAPIRPNLDFQVDSAHVDSIPAHLRAHWLGQVDVEGKRVWLSPKEFWARESLGARNASIRYDMTRAADAVADRGEPEPSLVEWLEAENPLFEGPDNITGEYRAANPYNNVHGDGPSYGKKGIMWIVDNRFVSATSVPMWNARNVADNPERATESEHIPFGIAEVRSVYVSTARDDWKRFVAAPQLEGHDIATIFIYSLPESQSRTPKGYRRTHFTGYSFPEDYARLTALMGTDLAGADYRRTLYWNPAVPLDASGRATLSFKNNSTSRHMTVSAMGFTPDGRPVSTW